MANRIMNYVFVRQKVSLYCLFFCLVGLGCEQDKSASKELAGGVPEDSIVVRDTSNSKYFYNVQIAALSDSSKARDLVVLLEKSHLAAYFEPAQNISGQPLYRINVGPFYDDSTAAESLARVKKLGYLEAFIKEISRASSISPGADSTLSLSTGVGVDLKQLTFSGGCRYPQWSPNGREIAFFKQEKAFSGIYSVGTGGGRISKIIESNASRRIIPKFSWSPQGDKVVFVAEEISAKFEKVENLYVINKNSSKLQQLLSQDSFPFNIGALKWAPDGKHLAFDANYGRVDPRADLVQNVFAVPLDKLSEVSDSPAPAYIVNPSFSNHTSWVVGWQSNDIVLFLTTDPENSGMPFTYAVWRCDLASDERKAVLKGPAVKNCVSVELLPGNNELVYSESDFSNMTNPKITKIVSVDLANANKTVLFESHAKIDDLSAFATTTTNEVFFMVNRQLWIFSESGRKAVVQLNFHANDFTVSPSGRRLCFVENGDLFTMKLD